ncbi:hypothetical protein KEM55_006620 [Ascosphaera atra]|nr:hypothetical protein KEM55_006620 [Ascosphaera atra]
MSTTSTLAILTRTTNATRLTNPSNWKPKRRSPNMAPSEETILNYFLAIPSHLPIIVSLEEFTEFFSRQYRSHPRVRKLYRELQHVRRQDVERIKENIDKDIERWKLRRRELAREYARNGGPFSGKDERYDVASQMEKMRRMCEDLKGEVKEARAAADRSLEFLTGVVSALNGLRYEKSSKMVEDTQKIKEATAELRRLVRDYDRKVENGK